MGVSTGTTRAVIDRWYGLNLCPDGDTKLKAGEASKIINFRVTRDGNLKKRPGTKTLCTLGSSKVGALWSGSFMGTELLCACCGRDVFLVEDGSQRLIGSFGTVPESVSILSFGGKLYFLTGAGYYCYDGQSFAPVIGYVPTVRICVTPGGTGEENEQINRLSRKRKLLLSPDGEGTEFYLGEKNILSEITVRSAADGAVLTGFGLNTAEGILSFDTAPPEGVNTIEVEYSAGADHRDEVEAMRYFEFYNGSRDSRIFLYGDGSSRCIYSGVDSSGAARADYFPALNELRVGEPDTPLAALLRHSSQLMCFKSGSSYCIRSGFSTAADGTELPVFYISPVNRSIGCSTPGQAQAVLNSPFTVFGGELYEWVNGGYSSSLNADERLVRRISDRIHPLLADFQPDEIRCFDDNEAQEYFIACGNRTLVYSYAADAWTLYEGIKPRCFARHRGRLYFGTEDGRLCFFGEEFYFDDSPAGHLPIVCRWESGSMSFGSTGTRKMSPRLWLSLRPESRVSLELEVRAGGRAGVSISQRLFDFSHMNFGSFCFAVSRAPEVLSFRLRTGRFVYYRLLLSSCSADTGVTVTGVEIELRRLGRA